MSKSGIHISILLSAVLMAGFFMLACPGVSLAAGAEAAASAPEPAEPQTGDGISLEKSENTPPPPPRLITTVREIDWRVLAEGMELALIKLEESRARNNDAYFVFVRITPERHAFSLHMASDVGRAFSLVEWSNRENLRAGINASMYLPDNVTSTGYMRYGTRVNNGNIGGNLGAFFVANRRKLELCAADIIERDSPGWRARLDDYGLVVQNYRLINSSGRVLWPGGGPEHSIAVIATDAKGRIVFALSQEPLTALHFASYLKHFPLDLKTVMYVEGGAQAGLFVRLEDKSGTGGSAVAATMPGAFAIPVEGGSIYVWKGRQSLLNMRGNPHAVLPNIIGVKRKMP